MAKVTVREKGEVAGRIGKGLFVLVGVKDGDSEKEAEVLANKLSKLRVMSDKDDKMNLTVKEVEGEVLVVSQFTLYADTSGGNRPSFIKAAKPEVAEPVYKKFVEVLRHNNLKVETGSFGTYMDIDCVLDGPVTIVIDSE